MAAAIPPAGVYSLHTLVRSSLHRNTIQREWRYNFDLRLPADGNLTWDVFVRRELQRLQLRPSNGTALKIGLVDYKRYLGGNVESDRAQKSDPNDWPRIFADDHRMWVRDFVSQKSFYEALDGGEQIKHIFATYPDLHHPQNFILFVAAAKHDPSIAPPAVGAGNGGGAGGPPAAGAAAAGGGMAVGAPAAVAPAVVAHALEYDPRGYFRDRLSAREVTALNGLIDRMRGEYQPHDTHEVYRTAYRRIQKSDDYLADKYNKQQLGTFPPAEFLTRLSNHAAVVCSLWIEMLNDPDNKRMGFIGTGFMISPQYMQTALHNLYVIPRDKPVLNSPIFEPRTGHPIHCCFNSSADGNKHAHPDEYFSFTHDAIVYPHNHDQLRTLQFDVVLVDLASASARNKTFLDAHVTAENCIRLMPRLPQVRFADTRALPEDRSQRVFVIGYPDTRTVAEVQREAFKSEQVTRLVSMNHNVVVGYDLGWHVFYSLSTKHGMSGGPGLFLDGRLACMHREGGAQHFGEGWSKSFFATGLRMDLFVRDAFSEGADELNQLPVPMVQTVADMWTEIKRWYANNP